MPVKLIDKYAFVCVILLSVFNSYGQTTLVGWTFPSNPDNNVADAGISANLSRLLTSTATNSPTYASVGPTTYASQATGWDNGLSLKYWHVSFSTCGFYGIKVSSKQRSIASGPRDFQLEYSTDNTVWMLVSGTNTLQTANNWTTGVLTNIDLPAACENQPNVYLRWIMRSNVNITGTAVNASSPNQIDDIIVTATSGNLASSSSDILAIPSSEATGISSIKNTAPIAALANGTQVWQFNIRDGGGSADADALSTNIASIKIDAGTGNTVTDWTNAINSAALFSGSTLVATGSVTTGSITFSGTPLISIADGSNTTLTLVITLKTTLNSTGNQDKNRFVFSIPPGNVTTYNCSSAFSTFTTINSQNLATSNYIGVVATMLKFVTQPSATQQGSVMSPSITVAATDANGNTDLDFSTNITLSVTSPTGCGYTSQTLSGLGGSASFSNIVFSRSPQTGITLTATSSGLTNATSNSFNVTSPAAVPTTTTIKNENFDGSTPSWSRSATAVNYSGGSDVTGLVNFGSPNNNSWTKSYSIDISSGGGIGSTSTTTFTNVTGLGTYSYVDFSFQIGCLGSGSGSGADAPSGTPEFIYIEISLDGGSSWSKLLTNNGYSNHKFSLSSSSPVSLAYNANAVYSSGDALWNQSAFQVRLPSGTTQFMFRMIANDNRTDEYWAIDNIQLVGTTTSSATAFNTPSVFGNNVTGCPGDYHTLSVATQNSNGNLSYVWSPATNLSSAVSATPLASPLSTVNYTVTITDVDNCKASTIITVSRPSGSAGLWTGAANEDWFNCRNWADGIIPTASTNVSINQTAQNHCVIESGNAVCNSINLSSNSGINWNLYVRTNGTLSISNALTISKTAGTGVIIMTLENNGTLNCGNLTTTGYTAAGAHAIFRHETSTAAATINGNLTINTGGLVDLDDGNTATTTDGTVRLRGNYTNNELEASFQEGNSTILVDGSANQTFTMASNIEVFYKLMFEKTGGDITLINKSEIISELELKNGIVNNSSSSLVTMRANAIVSGPASINSFITGPIAKISSATSSFQFPVGKTAPNVYRPFYVVPTATSQTIFQGEYFRATPTPYSSNRLGSIIGLVDTEHWELLRNSGTADARIVFNYKNPGSSGWADMAPTCADCNVAVAFLNNVSNYWYFVGSGWNGTDPEYRLYNNENDIYSKPIEANSANFGKFSLAYTSANLILPVKLLSFDAALQNNNGFIQWNVSSPKDLLGFDLEHSLDGYNFNSIAYLKENGGKYSYLHYNLQPGIHSYRLLVREKNGSSYYSAVKNLVANRKAQSIDLIRFQPHSHRLTAEFSSNRNQQSALSVYDAGGRLISNQSRLLKEGNNHLSIELPALPSGMYLLKIETRDGFVQTAKWINQN